MKFILLLLLSGNALSIEPRDDYYANDLLDAVDQAKASAHHYDYSHHYRYKRTTAQSIELNRLNLQELDETALKNKKELLDKTGISKSIIPSSNSKYDLNYTRAPLDSATESFPPELALPNLSDYTSSFGRFRSSGIQGESNIITTARP
jgi:hypothetical protein